MSAAELEVLYQTEIDQVESWRHDALQRAGYNRESALVLAASHDVDLHQAVDLVRRGCPSGTAVSIVT